MFKSSTLVFSSLTFAGMFPTLTHLIEYLTGFHVPLPIQTFGFMMALSFLAAAYTLHLELKRKEQLGLIKSFTRNRIIGKPASVQELILNFIGGFIIGYKILLILFNYSAFTANPQEFILSGNGNLFGGIIGGVLMAGLKYWEKKKQQLPEPKTETEHLYPHQVIGDITIVAAASGLLGAKLFDNMEHWSEFISDPIGALLSFSGLTFYGGLIFGSIAVLYYANKLGVKYYHMIDAAAPGLILAYAVGRGGCQLSGDGDWGEVNKMVKPNWLSFLPDWMWAFKYPHNVVNEGIPIVGCEGRFCMELPEAVYPTPFYEIVLASIIFIILWNIRKRINTPGLLFSIYLILNGVERFVIENIRVNKQYDIIGFSLSQAQIIALLLIAAGSFGLWYFNKNKHSHTSS